MTSKEALLFFVLLAIEFFLLANLAVLIQIRDILAGFGA